MRGWSRVLLFESANPPGASRASWPGYIVGTLWADRVLPEDSRRHGQEEGAGQDQSQKAERHAQTHKHKGNG